MSKRFILIQAVLLVAALMFMLTGCENDYPPSLYDPNYKADQPAVITTVEPADLALSGVTVITFTGSNFAPVKDDNIVYFNGAKGTILEATTGKLVVKAPIYAADSVVIRVAVRGAELFSNGWPYRLEPAQESAVKLTSAELPYALATDAEGNLYASMVISNAGAGVKKIAKGTTGFVDYAPKGGETFYSAIKMGPGNVMYCARNVKGVFSIASPGAKPGVFVSSGLGNIYDLDFDANKNLWGVGNNTDLYRMKPDKAMTKFPFKANLRAVRVYNNYLYVAGDLDKVTKVWRFPFVGEDLGPVEEVLNFTDKIGGGTSTIHCMTISADGYIYLGSDAPEAIFVASPSGGFEALYPGQFLPKIISMAWGMGTDLFVTREAKSDSEGKLINQQLIFRVNTQKQGAPQYGIL